MGNLDAQNIVWIQVHNAPKAFLAISGLGSGTGLEEFSMLHYLC